jgi:hypothetical protein
VTDHIPNDLSHLSDAEFNSLCPQGEHAPGPEPLSPAAQAVVKAVDHYETTHWLSPREVAAAALRVVATQVTPVSTNLRQSKIRYELLAIADELEAMSN